MDIGSLFLVLALLLLVALFVSRPLFASENKTSPELSSERDHRLSFLMAERDRLLNALQELDFDYSLGKIPEADYPAQRLLLLQQGADVLRELDTLQEGVASNDIEARLEAAIAARRADARRAVASGNGVRPAVVAASVAEPDDDLEVMLSNRRRNRKDKAGGFCPQCGSPVQKSDLFCPKCGNSLN